MSSYVKFKDITDTMCYTYTEGGMDSYTISTRRLPVQNKFDKTGKVRDIDIDAPIVYGFNENKLRRLKTNKIETDSSHHNNQNIKMAIYAKEI